MEKEKFVDESWKETIDKEKKEARQDKAQSDNKASGKIHFETNVREEGVSEKSQPEEIQTSQDSAQEGDLYEINFIGYITSLAYQAMVFLGQVPNPLDNKIEKNLQQAKLLIDTLVMLREKTKGNLNDQEDHTLNQLLYELQMIYVQESKTKESA